MKTDIEILRNPNLKINGDMNLYQDWTRVTAVYPHAGSYKVEEMNYAVLGLCGEAGEVADKWKKVLRGDAMEYIPSTTLDLPAALRAALAAELGDTLYYLARVSRALGYNLGDIAQMNHDKLMARLKAGTTKGAGDGR